MDARLDALGIDFDDELYPRMLTAITCRRWVIGNSLRLAVMKCGKSTELRQVLADVVSAEISKGMSEGLKYKLKSLKDALIDVIMASLHLESNYGEDAPQWIHELYPSSFQLKISLYLEKKKCRVVCRTHGVGFAHHVRPDGVPVSVPTVAPQGLAILLADATIQTETFEDGASSRLRRSKSLPAMYNLD
nr:hypothetical protein [Tanacetum cinerariifolium]